MVRTTFFGEHVLLVPTSLAAENIRVEADVMKRLGREDIGVRIPGDDAFIGTLNVYHEVHCLVRILYALIFE
jgi:hypothetical protein